MYLMKPSCLYHLLINDVVNIKEDFTDNEMVVNSMHKLISYLSVLAFQIRYYQAYH